VLYNNPDMTLNDEMKGRQATDLKTSSISDPTPLNAEDRPNT